MRRFFVIAAACLLTVCPVPAMAEDAAAPSTQNQGSKTAEIVIDEEAGTVRVLIDGQDVVVIDAAGLHVNGDITYRGVTRDTGDWAGKGSE